MKNILIVDDSNEKVQNIKRVLEPVLDETTNIVTAQDINGAKRELKKKNFDIMILDIYLPQMFGGETLSDGGMKLLREIKESRVLCYSYPKYVISVSAYKDSADSFAASEGIIHTSICYDISNTDWEKELLDRVKVALTIVSNTTVRRTYDYDIAVIIHCAQDGCFTLLRAIYNNRHKHCIACCKTMVRVIERRVPHSILCQEDNNTGLHHSCYCYIIFLDLYVTTYSEFWLHSYHRQ
mgnify:CR=1 FL=1